MGWKDWPTWLKGGVIGLFLGLFIVFAYFVSDVSKSLFGGNSSITIMTIIITAPFILIYVFSLGILFSNNDSLFRLGLYLSPIIYFIIGAIIGWIVGKIKGR